MSVATNIVHWPGKETAACDVHTEKLKALARFMGFTVSTEPCFTEEACKNCENERPPEKARKLGAAEREGR